MNMDPAMMNESMFNGRVDLRPEDIPLPPTRAGTVVSRADRFDDRPQQPIYSIDYASRVPLPDSRPTTMFSPPKGQQRLGRLAATVEVSLTASI